MLIRDWVLIIALIGYPGALFRARRSFGTQRSFGPLRYLTNFSRIFVIIFFFVGSAPLNHKVFSRPPLPRDPNNFAPPPPPFLPGPPSSALGERSLTIQGLCNFYAKICLNYFCISFTHSKKICMKSDHLGGYFA